MSTHSSTPSLLYLKKYADLLVKFCLNAGDGCHPNEVVYVTIPEAAKPFLLPLQQSILDSGGIPLLEYAPQDIEEHLLNHGEEHQITYIHDKKIQGVVEQADHRIDILAPTQILRTTSDTYKQNVILRESVINAPMFALFDKEQQGRLSRTEGLYATPQIAQEAGMTIEEYREQITLACFLDQEDPVAYRKELIKKLEQTRSTLNDMSIQKVHMQGDRCDLRIEIGENRKRLTGSYKNMPSFEIFTSPDRRGTQGTIFFDSPLYINGICIEDISLTFQNGYIIKATAKTNENVLHNLIAHTNADKVGEFSLTDRRYSRISKFMAINLYDENVGGPYGNSHIAIGSSYSECFKGNSKDLSDTEKERLGFNQSEIHNDIITRLDKTVTAYLYDGTSKLIYKSGEFCI